jgi:predicted dehydrogenase
VLELYGSKGSIIARGTIGQGESGEMLAYLEEEDTGYDAQQARTAGEGQNISPWPVNTYRAEIEEFSQAVIGGREPRNNAEIALQSQKVLSACYESARTGKVIEV